MKHLWEIVLIGDVKKEIFREGFKIITTTKKLEEKLTSSDMKKNTFVTTSEMDGLHRQPKDTHSLKNKLQQFLHSAVQIKHIGDISPSSTIVYARKVIIWVN